MPIYEYKCDSCGQVFEAIRPMKDADKAVPCKNCSDPHTHRKLSVCYAQGGNGSASSSGSGGCSGCSGGHCSSCGH